MKTCARGLMWGCGVSGRNDIASGLRRIGELTRLRTRGGNNE